MVRTEEQETSRELHIARDVFNGMVKETMFPSHFETLIFQALMIAEDPYFEPVRAIAARLIRESNDYLECTCRPDDPDKLVEKGSGATSGSKPTTPIKTHGESVYEELLPTLSEHEGKVVAIDEERKALAGVGDTIEEAYEKARERYPDKKQFYFRRVGEPSY